MTTQIRERVNHLARQGRLAIDDAAELLGVSKRTLYSWRAKGFGPKSVRYAGKLWYSADDCYLFIAQAEDATAKGSGL